MLNFNQILNNIYQQKNEIQKAGWNPTELWLGPTQYKIVEKYIEDQIKQGLTIINKNYNNSKAEVCGLRLYKSVVDGVFVS